MLLDQEKKKLVVQRKRRVYQVKTMFLVIPITDKIRRLPVRMVAFSGEFIGGLFQSMLRADAAAPSHDLIQVFIG